MFIVKLILIISLIILFLQDIKSRAVSWVIFPIIFLSTLYIQLQSIQLDELMIQFMINLFIILIQISFLMLYLKFTNKSWTELTSKYFAWGDILFFIILGLSFPIPFFIFFLIASIIISILISLILKFKTVPLAGFQAILFAFVLLFNINTSIYAI